MPHPPNSVNKPPLAFRTLLIWLGVPVFAFCAWSVPSPPPRSVGSMALYSWLAYLLAASAIVLGHLTLCVALLRPALMHRGNGWRMGALTGLIILAFPWWILGLMRLFVGPN